MAQRAQLVGIEMVHRAQRMIWQARDVPMPRRHSVSLAAPRTATQISRVARHTLEDHTGEIELRLEAATLGELFAEAARALAEIMGEPMVSETQAAYQEVSLRARDRNALLVDWLNELIFLAERDKSIFGDVRIDKISDRALEASVRGREASDLKLHVKAATFHGLDIRQGPEGFSANVILDV